MRKTFRRHGVDEYDYSPRPQVRRMQQPQRADYGYDTYPQEQAPVPQVTQYNAGDRPVTASDDKRFVKVELWKLKLRSLIVSILAFVILAIGGALIADYVTGTQYSFNFDNSITGAGHLVWMALGTFVGFVLLVIYGMRLYIVRKDSFRTRTFGQNDFYVPLSLKKYYRSLRSNNTFIHYFAFLAYIALALAIGIVYAVSYENTFINQNLLLIKTASELETWVITFGLALASVFVAHVVFIFLRYRKANVYDARFGHEIVPKEQIIEIKKRNRRICIFITLAIFIIGVLVYFILRKFKPSVPNLLSLKK